MGVRDGFEVIPVEERSAAITVLSLSVVLAIFTHTPTEASARQVHSHVKVTAVRVAMTATSSASAVLQACSWPPRSILEEILAPLTVWSICIVLTDTLTMNLMML